MKVAKVNTIACLVPSHHGNTSTAYSPVDIVESTLSEKCQLTAIVDHETVHWDMDRIVSDTGLLQKECTQLVKSTVQGYNSAFLSLCSSDGYKYDMDIQRHRMLQVIFNQLKTEIGNAEFKIEFAYLGISGGETFDFRKRILRTNESMILRDIDSIMRPIDTPDQLHDMMRDKNPTIPNVLFIKLTHTKTHVQGRLALIDLLYSPFSPFVKDAALNALHDVMSGLSTPKFTGKLALDSFMAKEISKYVCGDNQLLINLYLNNRFIHENHARDTVYLLSLISPFTHRRVHAFPNTSLGHSTDYKNLQVQVAQLKDEQKRLMALNSEKKHTLKEQDQEIIALQAMMREIDTTSLDTIESSDQKYTDKSIQLAEAHVNYLNTSLANQETSHALGLQQLQAEVIRLNAELDILEMEEQDRMETMKRDDIRFKQEINPLQQRAQALSEALIGLREQEKKLETTARDLDKTTRDGLLGEDTLEKRAHDLQLQIDSFNATISDIMRSRLAEDHAFEEKMKTYKELVKQKESEKAEKIYAIHSKANNNIHAFKEKWQTELEKKEAHLRALRKELEKAKNDHKKAIEEDDDDFQ